MNENPYASPKTGGAITSGATEAEFRDIFVGWEWLRLWYNGALVALTITIRVLLLGRLRNMEFWETCLLAGIGANVCYCMGPVIECYAAWLLQRRTTRFRHALFALGLVFSALLAILGTALISIGPFPG